MKSYTLICFFLAVSMIMSPLCSVKKVTDVIYDNIDDNEEIIEIVENIEVSTVKVMSASSKNITEMTLNEYLLGVIAAEVNATYHEEAIKAQIVAANTVLSYVKAHKNETLGNADITDSSTTHQGFLTREQQIEKWGDNYEVYTQKIQKCIDAVEGQTLQYNGECINAVFHAMSNGQTENAVNVWGGNYPYLKSVPSVGDTLSPAFISTAEFSADEFKAILKNSEISFNDTPEKWVEKITNTETGMVKTVTICGKEFKGTEIRSLFSLKSSTFSVEYKDGKFIFTVKGYGHGVGMSQYGANHLANQGYTYEEILKHYYTGAEIKNA